ncbi:hypothetical protein M3Y96_00633500 [Aphelenchoides besseyi]|nr:hypothetical protein M3Y96_00633500 [Aphelenchoides besseyi]
MSGGLEFRQQMVEQNRAHGSERLGTLVRSNDRNVSRAPVFMAQRQVTSTNFLPNFRRPICQPLRSVPNNIPPLKKRVNNAYRRRDVYTALPKCASSTTSKQRVSHLQSTSGPMVQEAAKKLNVQFYFGVHDIDTLSGHLSAAFMDKYYKCPTVSIDELTNPIEIPKVKKPWKSKIERTFTDLDNSEIDCIWEVDTILLRKYLVVFPGHIDGVRAYQYTGKRINWNPNDKTAYYELPNSAANKRTNQQVSIAIPTIKELQKIRRNKLLEHEMEIQRETNEALNTIIELMDTNIVSDE